MMWRSQCYFIGYRNTELCSENIEQIFISFLDHDLMAANMSLMWRSPGRVQGECDTVCTILEELWTYFLTSLRSCACTKNVGKKSTKFSISVVLLILLTSGIWRDAESSNTGYCSSLERLHSATTWVPPDFVLWVWVDSESNKMSIWGGLFLSTQFLPRLAWQD